MTRFALLIALATAGLALASGCSLTSDSSDVSPRQERGASDSGVPYVDNSTCSECHQSEFEAWTGSHHDLAMQAASAEAVLGDFGDATFTHFGVTSRFFTDEGRFFVNTEGPDGALEDFEIAYTFGVEPLQQYLVPFPGGRLQSLTIAWDTENGRWFHLYPDEPIPAGDTLHWTGLYQTWNVMCAECHSTNVRKNFDIETETYATVWDEIDVSCQSCHGPGSAHVDWARASDGSPPATAVDAGLVVDIKTEDPDAELNACAGCHSRRLPITPRDRHGRPLLDDYRPATLRDELYHPDGQIKDEVYVWGSFVQSKMHGAGVRCSNCHDPHGLGLRATGNAVCTQCHNQTPSARFPTLRMKEYDSPAHHFHQQTSDGAQCANCHMPAQTYMGVDPRRDHSFRIPRPDLSLSIGSPNACTICHTDQTNTWAAEQTAAWWEGDPTAHYGEALAAGRTGAREALGPLVELVNNAEQPGIVRATALEQLRQYGPIGIQAIAAATTDEDPLVRAAAVGGLERLPPQRRIEVVAPLLADPIRDVRITASRVLASVPREQLDAALTRSLELTGQEFAEAQMASADMPASRLNLGVLYALAGRLEEAEAEYLTAIRMDPLFLPARFNVVNLYNGQGRNDEAEVMLRAGIEQVPEEGELHYSLGLLLVEMERVEEATVSLGRAADLIPNRARPRYNYGLALEQLGRLDDAEAALIQAHEINSEDSDVLVALVNLLMERSEWERAREHGLTLRRLNPTAPGVQRLLNEIQIRELRSR